ncbi:MAG: thiamine pyrophosphate-dependent enzyme, partial [Ancalomicrobiaceae bacterium]|nr:thiamine pyrophosphate-dependent enzyme [Ancalomicrobiaceae bacterium]
KPLIIAGGGVLYSGAAAALAAFAERHAIPVSETQAGKSSLAYGHDQNVGSIGVTGASAANVLAEEADVILAVGSRLQDFTTGSWGLFKNPNRRIVGLNTQVFDAAKHRAEPLVADALAGLAELSADLGGWQAPEAWKAKTKSALAEWRRSVEAATAATNRELPADAEVIGAVERVMTDRATVVCASGGLPGELHKLWKSGKPGSYHLEYGYSCMGYEIAAGLGVKMAKPNDDVIVMLGDGSYLMANSEIATSVMLGKKLTIVVLDNRGFGCINRLQMATGGANFNNLLADTRHETLPDIDFAAHAAALGAISVKVASIADLETALEASKSNTRTTVLVVDTDPLITTEDGGHWWEVAVPEVSARPEVNAAREAYEAALKLRQGA